MSNDQSAARPGKNATKRSGGDEASPERRRRNDEIKMVMIIVAITLVIVTFIILGTLVAERFTSDADSGTEPVAQATTLAG